MFNFILRKNLNKSVLSCLKLIDWLMENIFLNSKRNISFLHTSLRAPLSWTLVSDQWLWTRSAFEWMPDEGLMTRIVYTWGTASRFSLSRSGPDTHVWIASFSNVFKYTGFQPEICTLYIRYTEVKIHIWQHRQEFVQSKLTVGKNSIGLALYSPCRYIDLPLQTLFSEIHIHHKPGNSCTIP